MAKGTNNSASMFLNMAMVLSLILSLAMVDGRPTRIGFQTVKSTLECNAVTGVVSGDTCAALAQSFGLTATSFAAINPNLDCNKLFVGQWVCIDGTTS